MIYLPNKFERYTAALRNTIQLSVINSGLKPRHIKMLIKIYEAEAKFSYEEKMPIDIGEFSHKLLLAAHLLLLNKNRNTYFKVNIKGIFYINKKLFTALLLNICKSSDTVFVYYLNGRIIVKCKTAVKLNFAITKFLNAVSLFETKSQTQIIFIKADKTDKKGCNTEKEWDILNPFSPVNIYLT